MTESEKIVQIEQAIAHIESIRPNVGPYITNYIEEGGEKLGFHVSEHCKKYDEEHALWIENHHSKIEHLKVLKSVLIAEEYLGA